MGNQNERIEVEREKYDDVVEITLKMAMKLWKKYNQDYLDPNFCKNIELAYQQKLEKLPIKQLESINKNIQNNNKKFDLVLKYQPPKDELFVVPELHEELVDLFQNKQKGGELSNILDNSNLHKFLKEPSSNLQSNDLNQELSKIAKTFNLNLKNNKPENNKPDNDKHENDKRENDKQEDNKKLNEEIVKVVNDINRVVKNNKIRKFPHCNNKTQQCKLTKDELCQAITQHYIMRSKLLTVILNVLPRKEGNKWIQGGICQQRLNALDKVKLCLPPGFKNVLEMPNKETEIRKYAKALTKEQCKELGGYYKEINKEEKESLFRSDNPFNKFYIQYTLKIRDQYIQSLKQLQNIILLLENETSLNNHTLNQLSYKVKDIIDNMEEKCENNYRLAVLAYLKADLNLSTEKETQLLKLLETSNG